MAAARIVAGRPERTLVLVALMLMTALPLRVDAQSVVGSVVEADERRPLAGAFVVLQDSAGGRAAAGLAGPTGRFALRAPRPGTYRLLVQLIGYRDTSTEPFVLSAGQTLERDLEVAVRAVDLEPIRARVGERCSDRPGRGAGTAVLWDEARKALEIAGWSRDEVALRFRIVEHVRELDARSLRVTAAEERPRRGWFASSPYRSIPPARLEAGGFIQPAPDGQWNYYAPDGEVLLSDWFLDTHCFTVAASSDPALVGLAFRPVRGRTAPDIEGVLWLERGTAELERLEFRYVNLPYLDGSWSQVGGRVDFERLSNGVWIVRRWYIRMPLKARRVGGHGGERADLELAAVVEEGAEVLGVRTAGGDLLARVDGATLYGSVRDSTTGRPLDGARLELDPTGRAATTDAEGAYRLGDLPTGRFQLRLTHPELLLLAGEPLRTEVQLDAGRATHLELAAPLTRLALERCAAVGTFADPAVVYGYVRAPGTGSALPGARVRVLAGGAERRVTSDSLGAYAACVERVDSFAVMAGGVADGGFDASNARWSRIRAAGTLTRHDITIDPGLVASLPSRMPHRGRRWSNALVGTVVREGTREPVGGAMVVVSDAAGRPVHSSVTDDEGRFRFVHPDPRLDRFDLAVQHVAYGKVEQTLEFRAGEQLDIEVVLAGRAIEVEPVVVTARRAGFLVDAGFYDRLERSTGRFIQRDEIERRAPSRLTDLLQGQPGWQVLRTADGKEDIRVDTAVRLGGDCQPAVWVDGVQARAGGEPRVAEARSGETVYLDPQLSEMVAPEQVEAIEMYQGPAGLPIRFGGSDSSCGVVVIWTRRTP